MKNNYDIMNSLQSESSLQNEMLGQFIYAEPDYAKIFKWDIQIGEGEETDGYYQL